jgi:small subunit ribosomal protein S20
MPLTSSAKKAHRSSLTKRTYNLRRVRAMRLAIKEARKLAEYPKSAAELSRAYQAIDKAAKRGVIKKNTAARYKSRLALIANKKV